MIHFLLAGLALANQQLADGVYEYEKGIFGADTYFKVVGDN